MLRSCTYIYIYVFLTYKSIAKDSIDYYNAIRDCGSNPISSPNTLFRKRLHPLQFLSFFAFFLIGKALMG